MEQKVVCPIDSVMLGEKLRPLTPYEQKTLARTARSRTEPHGVAIRAQIVLDCAGEGFAAAARRSGVSAQTAAKWWRRFSEGGVEGLRDSARNGRPPAAEDDVAAVLDCSLREPPSPAQRWSTRMVAAEVGMSQATVSRIRRRFFPRPNRRLIPDASTSVLVYVDVHSYGCALGFARVPGTLDSPSHPEVLADVIETISCAALLQRPHTGYVAGEGEWRANGLLRRAADKVRSGTSVTLIIDQPLDESSRAWLTQHPDFTVQSVSPARWHEAVCGTADTLDPRQVSELQMVQRNVWAARRDGRREFTWIRSEPGTADARSMTGRMGGGQVSGARYRPRNDRVVVVEGICSLLRTGELRPNDLISDRMLARRTGMNRSRVTEALTQLAEDLVIDRREWQYVIPSPSVDDITETYTARVLLGTGMVRRIALGRLPLPQSTRSLLTRLTRCCEAGLAHEAYVIDLAFQDSLAGASNLSRMVGIFERLSLQIHMFIHTIGLNYSYPIDEIVKDAEALVVALEAGDVDAALMAWRRKFDSAVRYMTACLNVGHSRRPVGPEPVSARGVLNAAR